MAAWWSPLGDGLRRLTGREGASAPDAAGPPVGRPEPAPDVAPARPAQAWPWQPPVQRALDPEWEPRLRPDAFAAGLTSHQDPSFRRDLVHDVRPAVGGLVDGLADLVPGPPRTQPAAGDLTVRPVRPAHPEVQRSPAPFASFSPATTPDSFSTDASSTSELYGAVSEPGPDQLTTVGLEPPWLAEPAITSEPSRPDPVVEVSSTPSTGPTGTAPTESRPVGTPRDVRVQRHEADAPPEPGASAVPVEPPLVTDEPARPTATPPRAAPTSPPPAAPTPPPPLPTVARTTTGADPAASVSAPSRPVVAQRVLPVSAPPPPRAARPEPPGVRALPVVQRAADPTVTGPPPPALSAIEARPSVPEAPPEARPEPSTASLSGFAEAIQRLSVPSEVSDSVQHSQRGAVVPGPVVPARVTAADRGTGTTDLPSAADVPAAVQRDTTADEPRGAQQESTAAPAVDDPAVDDPAVEVAPLVGGDDGAAAVPTGHDDAPALQRAVIDDLPVIPVARATGRPDEADVPRLEVVSAWGPQPPPAPSVSSASSDLGPHPAPVVARTLAGSPSAAAETSGPSGTSTTGASGFALPAPVVAEASVRTAPLSGSRSTAVQRSAFEPAVASSAAIPEAARPLRFESVASVRAAAAGRSSTPTSRSERSFDVPAGTFLQRAAAAAPTAALPAVAPGLVGPGPGEPAPAEPSVTGHLGASTGTAPTWSHLADHPAATVGGGRDHAYPVQTVQRLAAPASTAQTVASPVAPPSVNTAMPSVARPPVRALPFDQMFAGAGAAGSDTTFDVGSDVGWTSVDLPVVGDGGFAVQRAEAPEAATAEPPAPAPAADPGPSAAPAAPAPAAPAAPPAAGLAGADLDEMARRLFDPLSARLRAELWMDRERSGLVVDARL